MIVKSSLDVPKKLKNIEKQFIRFQRLRSIYYATRNFVHNLGNFFKWGFYMWSDRNWDYQYLHNMLEHKLREMLKYYQNAKNVMIEHKERMKIVKELKKALHLLHRYHTHNYFNDLPEYKNFIKKFGKSKWSMKVVEGSSPARYQMLSYWTKLDKNDTKNIEKANKIYIKCCNRSSVLQQNDINEFWNLLRDRSAYWWD